MKGNKIFVVDDDPGILRLIGANLEVRGYESLIFNSGTLALAQLDDSKPDLVILDILLPGVDGIELVRRIRETSGVPIMMISAKEGVDTKLEALDLGADDYLTKPFSIEELLARVRSILRRAGDTAYLGVTGTYHCGDFDVDLDRSEVLRSGQPVKLSAREWAVLRTFIRYAGRVVTRCDSTNTSPAGLGARVRRRGRLHPDLRDQAQEKVGAPTPQPPVHPDREGHGISPGQYRRGLP